MVEYVDKTGQMGSVLTVYELVEGEDTKKELFHGLDHSLFMKVLEYIEKQNQGKVFTASDVTKVGIKFFKR